MARKTCDIWCSRCDKRPRMPRPKHRPYLYCQPCMREYQRELQGYTGESKVRKATGICAACHEAKRLSYTTCCLKCNRKRKRKGYLTSKYGISQEEYDSLLDRQDGVCAICLGRCPQYNNLSVDHDHKTGKVRGLLCTLCNQGLGDFKDDPKLLIQAAHYLVYTL